tara:strand:- start:1728 stop:3125 length:1398 start_codon:yes stop_codon:yes gene_type:complete
MPNLLIPCSGPGSRSIGYTKFHKALIRISDCAVIDHIINSFENVEKIYITLGYEAEYIQEYIQHTGRKNVEFIEIENWNSSQIASFKQIPSYVFDEPLYYNACDNWSTSVATVDKNTWFTCTPKNAQYYDTSEDVVYSGISYIKDSREYYDILQATDINRNDLLLLQQLNDLQSVALDDWYDVGNEQSYQTVKQDASFSVLDKTHQEIYSVNGRIIKLFTYNPGIQPNSNYPHPQPIKNTKHGLSYSRVQGKVNPINGDFNTLFNNLQDTWRFSTHNNISCVDRTLWQDKTWERFDQIVQQFPEFSGTVQVNGQAIDCTRTVENIDWDLVSTGVVGACHGDLVVDNIIVGEDQIHYIDHRPGVVNDIFYDICKFYHSLHLHNRNLKRYKLQEEHKVYKVNLSLSEEDELRLNAFRISPIYCQHKRKIELGVGCIWLSMSPLNVDKNLNKFLFLLAIEQLKKHERI